MLVPTQIVPFLDHADRDVREYACRYLAEGNDRGGATADDFWRVIDRFGAKASITFYTHLEEMPQTEASYARLLAALREGPKGPYRLHLRDAFARLDWGLLLAHRDEVLSFDAVPADLREHQAKRLALEGVPLDELWDQFLARAEEVRGGYLGRFDAKVHERLIEAMARQYPGAAAQRAAALLPGPDDGGWLELFCAELLGKVPYRPAVPALLASLEIEDDLLPDWSARALARAGDADVVRRIEAFFPTANRLGQVFVPEALGKIKRPESEAALLRLLKAEVRAQEAGGDSADGEVLTFLAGALVEVCPTVPEALEALRDLIVRDRYDTSIIDLEEELLTVGKMVGYDPPEAVQWRKKAAEWEERRLDTESAYERFRPLFEWDEDEDREADEDGAADVPPARPGWAPAPQVPAPPPYEPLVPIRRGAPKVGRNDPCPCGSGKKYKKCCMAKEGAG